MSRVGLSVGVAAAMLCAASGYAHAQQQQFGQPPGTYVTWGTNTPGGARIDVTYFVGDPSMPANMANLIRQAAAAWNGVQSGIHLVESSDPPGPTTTANIVFVVGATPGTIVFPTIRPTTGLMPGTLNGAPWVQINGQVFITVSSLFMPLIWDGTGVQPALTFDGHTIALQMVGFGLGLGPAAFGDPNSVMTTGIPPGPGFTAPTAADAGSLQAVYGSPEPATFALFGVGLAALGLTRKRRRA